MAGHLLFVIGASGAGKTAAVDVLARRALADLACLHFDSIGVPSEEEMTRSFGSGERWQERMTEAWMARTHERPEHLVILEGQTRPSFIRGGRACSHRTVGIVLLDCDAGTRSRRLRVLRGQPELDHQRMRQWAAYLRGQADALGLPIIDTTRLSAEQVADVLYDRARTIPRWATTA